MSMPLPKMPADWEWEPTPDDADPFRYGWRPKYVHLPGGKVEEQRIPLTAADLLDPQFGDVILESVPHAKISSFLYVLLFVHYEKEADVLVTHDVKMVWGIPGLAGPAPDAAVIRGIRNKEEPRDVFDVLQEGARPCLVIEVVSPKYEEVRRNDYVDKKGIYERAGIPEYLIVEPYRVPGAPIRPWIGYRLGFDGRYQGIEPDAEGRLLSKTTGLLFGIAEDGGFQVTDVRTGERLLNQSQLSAAREDAEERATREAGRATREAGRAVREAERADREAEARKAADAEIARLQAELERISKG